MINRSTESNVNVPVAYKGNQTFIWYKKEIEALLDKGPFDGIAIKHNENVQSCYTKLQDTMFFDCIATIVALEHNIKVKSYVYKQLQTNAQGVLNLAENLVGKTDTHWDKGIADAIVAANYLLKEL